MIVGLIGALHDRRVHDPVRVPHLLRRAPRRRRRPASPSARERARASSSRSYILSGLAIVAGFANLPVAGCQTASTLRFEYFVAARWATTSPQLADGHVQPVRRGRARRSCGLLGILLALRVPGIRGPRPHGATGAEQSRPGRVHGARQQVLPRLPLHGRHRRRRQGPDRPGVLLVQPERASTVSSTRVGVGAARSGRVRLRHDRPGGGRRRRERIRRSAPRSRGQLLRRHPERQGPAVRRAPVRRRRHPGRHLSRHPREQERGAWNNDSSTDWGLSLAVFLPLVGVAGDDVHPEGARSSSTSGSRSWRRWRLRGRRSLVAR